MRSIHQSLFNESALNKRKINITGVLILLLAISFQSYCQLSPGPLADPHSNLEGLSKCTQCHVLGNKVTNDKCLTCHTEINARISLQKGYHSSSDVKGKDCFSCHSEHNGKNFNLIRLDERNFNHALTGYQLSVPHSGVKCVDCHNTKFINDQQIKAKKRTYLGLDPACLTCHADYHQQTLPANCLLCHDQNAFRPAAKFSHDNARFRLAGKHKTIACLSCHKKEVINGKPFQEFRGLVFSNCTSCHKDPHDNQFGQNCRQCHNEDSFQTVSGGVAAFDHNKTGFKLEGRHALVTCSQCHKTKISDPLKHGYCTDCHSDYHTGQFIQSGVHRDCSECHSVKGFAQCLYTIEQHNAGKFMLKGSHGAVPCAECHKKQDKWSFRNIGLKCAECHKDIHKTYIEEKYYPDADCGICHSEESWSSISSFDHSKTGFTLTGAHLDKSCRACHFRPDSKGISRQQFAGISESCSACHTDHHNGQFVKNGETKCDDCHRTDSWRASRFDHNNTSFRLEGKHLKITCSECHKPQKEGDLTFVRYKIKDFRCESCH